MIFSFLFLILIYTNPNRLLDNGAHSIYRESCQTSQTPFFSSFLLFLEVLHGNFTHLGQNSPSRTEIQIQRHRQTTRLGKAGVFFSGIPSWAAPLHFYVLFFFFFTLQDSLERR
ncbi:hypothetical protein J3E69DRAFT_150496 [Trichoderma sp. SZMC 28015]